MEKLTRNYDLTTLLKPYENKWVALSFDYRRVLGVGDTLAEAKRNAQQSSKERFVCIKLPPYGVSYVPVLR
jgi:hypothetical protein